MSTRTGFPRMDWDTGFLADPKFQHLRDLLPDPIQFGYAGFCYLRLTADAWRTCQRRPISAVVRGIEPWAVEALREAALLDVDQLSQEGFDKWVGAAIQTRDKQAEYTRRSRGNSASVSPSKPYTDSVNISESVPSVGTVGPVEKVGPVGAREGVLGTTEEETDLFAFLAQRGAFIRPESGMGQRLLGLVDRRGIEDVIAKAKEFDTGERMSDRQWVFGLEKALEAIPSPPMDELLPEQDAKSRRIFEQMQKRRLEWFEQTGKWEADWGERPGAAA